MTSESFEIGSGIHRDLESKIYHGLKGSYSSTQLKDLLDDPEYFYRKHILKAIEREEMPAFDIGTYFHTAILEPHKLKLECAVYDGIRRGKEWEAFKAANSTKAIITKSELVQAETLVKAVQNSPVAMTKIRSGEPEVSAFVKVYVSQGDVYHPDTSTKLGKFGWEPAGKEWSKDPDAVSLILKTRADLLGEGFILDLKSTTGNAKSPELMRKRVVDYQYHFSAALYLDIFTAATGSPYTEFLWVFASKDMGNSKTYKASVDAIRIGRAKWKKAAVTLAECIRKNWVFNDEMATLEAPPWEYEHIKERAEDLL